MPVYGYNTFFVSDLYSTGGSMKSLKNMAVLLALVTLAACSMLPAVGSQATPEGGTAMPNPLTPTPELGSFRQDYGQVCNLARLKAITTTTHQGSLIAWSPDGKKIAYVTPSSSHAMFSGDLVIASAPDFQPSAPIASGVTGGLLWSPSGERIAYTEMRPGDNIFTVAVTILQGNQQIDLFPGQQARMDSFSSPKVATTWNIEDRLRVQAACGDSCVKYLELSPTGGGQTELPEPSPTEVKANWASPRNGIPYDEKNYPQMNDPNWSNDGSYVDYYDQDGFLWVLSLKESRAMQIQMDGKVLPIYLSQSWDRETKWSGGFLAVRINSVIDLFDVNCRK
jgi:hypothetical protein